MNRRKLLQTIPAAGLLPAAKLRLDSSSTKWDAKLVYELRVYHCYEGKLPDLLKRFREHTMKIFEKHSIKNVSYFVPTDDPQKANTLIYIIAHASREAAATNWKAFGADPEWQAVQKASEANGKLVEKVDSTFMALTDFSYSTS